MNYKEAEIIISKYVDIIANRPNGTMAMRGTSLPCPKDKIVTAYKIFMAHVIKYSTLTKEQFNQYMILLNIIDSFINDEEAKMINDFYKLSNDERHILHTNHPKQFDWCMDFSLKMAMSDKHDEVVDFINNIHLLDMNDPLWCQRVYSLANIEYKPEYKKYFDNSLDEETKIKNYSSPVSLDEPRGIGGWLILVLIYILTSILSLFVGFKENFSSLSDPQLLNNLMTKGHPKYSPYWKSVIILQTIIQIIRLIYIVFTLIAFFKNKKSTIKLMIIFYILVFVYPIIILLSGNIIPFIAEKQVANGYGNLSYSIIASLIWISYFIKSKRVRNTFIN